MELLKEELLKEENERLRGLDEGGMLHQQETDEVHQQETGEVPV